MSDAGVTVKFFGDVTSINAALAKLEQKQESLARAQERNAAKARSVQDEQVVAAVKAHEKEAKAAEKSQLESMRRREQAASKLKILEIKAVEEAASAVKRAEAEKLSYKQGVIARVKAMEESHASSSKANFISSSGRGQTSSRFLDEGQAQKQKNIAAAIKLKEIRDFERSATAAKRAAMEPDASIIDNAGESLSRYLGVAALAGAAVKTIAAEWDNVLDRQHKAGLATMSFEEVLGEAAINIGEVMPADVLKDKANKLAASAKVKPEVAARSIALAVKGGGATTPEEAEKYAEAASAATHLMPRASADQIASVSGSVADYMARRNVSGKEAAGVLLSMQSKSNVADAAKGMEAFGPVVANMMAVGASDKMFQSMGPSLSQALSDKEGSETATAAIAFTTSLAKAGESRFAGQKNIPDLMLQHLRDNPEDAKRFFEGDLEDMNTGAKLGKPELGKGKAETYFRSISGDASLPQTEEALSFRRQYDENARLAKSGKEAADFYDKTLSQKRGATPVSLSASVLESGTSAMQLGDKEAGRGALRDKVQSALEASGAGWMEKKMQMWHFDAGSDQTGVGDAIGTLERRQKSIIGSYSGTASSRDHQQDKTRLDALTEMIVELKAIRESNEAMAKQPPPRRRDGNVENTN